MKRAAKYFFILFLLSSAAPLKAALFEPIGTPCAAGQSEVTLYGTLNRFNLEGKYLGGNLDFGGSGGGIGMSGLRYLNSFASGGFDISYNDNGKGSSAIIGGSNYSGSAEHITGLLYGKLQVGTSPLLFFISSGIGADYLKTYVLKPGETPIADRSAGLSLMAGAGITIDTGAYSFISFEGRYNYNNYLGGNEFGANHITYPSLLFKAGMRFEGDIFL